MSTSNPNPLVSIIMPVKNAASFLSETLQSILKQSYSNWELITINDHSTDQSASILKKYADTHPHIQLLPNHGNGIIDALQTGYQSSKGMLITRMDADDLMTPDKLTLMVNSLISKGSGYVTTGWVHYFSETTLGEGFIKYEEWLNHLTTNSQNFSEIYKECCIPSPCWMVWKSDFEKCGGFNSNIYPEDYDLVFRFYQHQLKVIGIQKVLHHWRDYSTRTSRTHEHYADSSFIDIKVRYFLRLSYLNHRPLILWGAGSKGKRVAQLLQKEGVPFTWICDNPKKIGKEIYGEKLLAFDALDDYENAQSMVTVANPKAQTEIKRFFGLRNKKPMEDYFFFC